MLHYRWVQSNIQYVASGFSVHAPTLGSGEDGWFWLGQTTGDHCLLVKENTRGALGKIGSFENIWTDEGGVNTVPTTPLPRQANELTRLLWPCRESVASGEWSQKIHLTMLHSDITSKPKSTTGPSLPPTKINFPTASTRSFAQ